MKEIELRDHALKHEPLLVKNEIGFWEGLGLSFLLGVVVFILMFLGAIVFLIVTWLAGQI